MTLLNVVPVIQRDDTAPSSLIARKRVVRFGCSVILLIGDLLALSAAIVLANLLYWGDPSFREGVSVLLATAPLYIGIAALRHVFSVELLDHPMGGASRAISAYVQAAVAVFSIAYFLSVGAGFSRGVFGIGIVLTIGLLPPLRMVARRLARFFLADGMYSVIVIRDDVDYEPHDHEAVVSPAQIGFDPETKDPFQFHALAHAVRDADRVVVACSQQRYALWASVLKSMTISGEILTDEHDHLGIIGVGQQAGRRTMIVTATPLDLGERILKRSFDLTFAILGLVVIAPVLIATAIAIRLDSPGPILFRQDRIGRDNRIFQVFKFRSMFANACDARADRLTSRNDARVTRIGAFIRKTSIDELPQLFNVLRGEMSIVGPRPHPLGAKAADLLYWDVDARYRHRHAIKPGLTGLAQVRGFRGNTERVEDLTNRLGADLEYALNWSVWRDIQIVGRTVLVLIHPNAF